MSRKPKFSKEIKMQACEDYHNGKKSIANLAKEIGCSQGVLRRWYSRYITHGSSVFDCSPKNTSYDAEFKTSVVKSYLSGEYSIAGLGAKHNISYAVVQRWIKKYNNGIDLKSYDPKGDVCTMKARKTTFEERLEIVHWVISNDMNYKEAAIRYAINYALVYKWTKSYLKDGEPSLEYKKRGPSSNSNLSDYDLSEIEQLKQALEKEIALRKRREFELDVLKKKEEFEKKIRYRR